MMCCYLKEFGITVYCLIHDGFKTALLVFDRAFELGEEPSNEIQQPPKANYAKILECEGIHYKSLTALSVYLLSFRQMTNPLQKCHTLCLLWRAFDLFNTSSLLIYLTSFIRLSWILILNSHISLINDAEDENASEQLEDDSVDQDRAAEVEYLTINNTFPSPNFNSKMYVNTYLKILYSFRYLHVCLCLGF